MPDDATVKQHFVVFSSPGTFFDEETSKPISSWDRAEARRMAKDVVERYGATPMSYRFITRGRGPNDLDSRVLDRSPNYYLGGIVETTEIVEKRGLKDEATLLRNMKNNDWNTIVRKDPNTKGWAWTKPLLPGDEVETAP